MLLSMKLLLLSRIAATDRRDVLLCRPHGPHTPTTRAVLITRDGQVRELDAVIAAPASVDAAPMDHYQFGDLLGCGPCLAFIDEGKSARAPGDCIGSAERHPIDDTDLCSAL